MSERRQKTPLFQNTPPQEQRRHVRPAVTEIKIERARVEHDDFIDGLSLEVPPPDKQTVATHLAQILDLNANVYYLDDYKENVA